MGEREEKVEPEEDAKLLAAVLRARRSQRGRRAAKRAEVK